MMLQIEGTVGVGLASFRPKSTIVSTLTDNQRQIEFRLRSDPDSYTCYSLRTNPQNQVMHLTGCHGQVMTNA